MRMCDSSGIKWDREELKLKDARICHWGNDGSHGSSLAASSCLTNGWRVFKIGLQRGDQIRKSPLWIWPPSFYIHLSLSGSLSPGRFSLSLYGSPSLSPHFLKYFNSMLSLLSIIQLISHSPCSPPPRSSFTVSPSSLSLYSCLSPRHLFLCPMQLYYHCPPLSIFAAHLFLSFFPSLIFFSPLISLLSQLEELLNG